MASRKRSVNPQFREPRDYLRNGLYHGERPWPGLHGEWAAAMGRECLVRGVPLELLGALVRDLDGAAREGPPAFAHVAARPAYRRHPLLADLLSAGLRVVRTPGDVKTFAGHVRRIYTLAAFTRTLGQAAVLEAIAAHRRARRGAQVRKGRRSGLM